MKDLLKTRWESAFTISAYEILIQSLVDNSSTTGDTTNDALINYTKLNAQRYKRQKKTFLLAPDFSTSLANKASGQKWLVISESWCGDAANSLPALIEIAKIAGAELRISLRDEDTRLIDSFLTNGGRAIPKLISIDPNWDVLFDWGPRPTPAQNIYIEWKNNPDKEGRGDFHIPLQNWYNKDAGQTIQKEITALIQSEYQPA